MKQLLHESIVFANKAHKGQLRKGTDIDYINNSQKSAAEFWRYVKNF